MASLKLITNVFVYIFCPSCSLADDRLHQHVISHLLYTSFKQFTLNSRIQSWSTLFLHGVCMLRVK